MFEAIMIFAMEICAPQAEPKCVNWVSKCMVDQAVNGNYSFDNWGEVCLETMPYSVEPKEW